MSRKIAVVGLGKIALDQHLPAIASSPDWQLAATVSSSTCIDGVENFASIEALLQQRQDIRVVSLCVPPAPRFSMAVAALNAGCDLMLEKPPGATLVECELLQQLAAEKGASLYTTWHSCEADQIDRAKDWLSHRVVTGFDVTWCEDVRRWHPGQEWIWQPAGMGVFDSGINALSILTKVLPSPVRVVSATLEYPRNKQTPIAADVTMQLLSGVAGRATFDWRVLGDPIWTIEVQTEDGALQLLSGGKRLLIDGQVEGGSASDTLSLDSEYPRLYASLHQLVQQRRSRVDLRPMQLVSDTFSIASRELVAPFEF